ncbi:CBM35 domain-containing protein [Rathayibacter sp. AY2B9]|uniref:CBM35 domain-containing protein n=1 Tax=Rathayibacter sp. AY2B9 TaxID=2080572 RepID=UPI0011B040AF|nr:CBM35 domain-containing protein [Rathayibacter sp. AY2B9]
MKKASRALACAAALGVALSGLGLTAVAAPANAAVGSETLAVDFSRTTGDFRGGATGTLYGFGDEGAPTQALIDGAHITNTSQKAPFGTQHPSGDALKVEDGFFAKHGEDMYIYTQDYYPDWAYNGGKRPGDTRTYDQATGTYANTPNGVWDYLEIVEFVTEAVATKSDRPQDYVHIPFNEPDGGNWYNDWGALKDTFLADWKAAYDVIQEVYARHGLGTARVGGPGDASYQPARTADFLDYAESTGTLPQVMIWHELGIDNLATFRSHLEHYRGLEDARGIPDIPINITEYGMLRDMGTPGQLIQWLSMFEDEKVDAQVAYWNYAGNLSDNSARPNAANAGWWMFKWYGDLEGSKTVAVTPPKADTADTLQGIGAIDAANKRATVLYGGSGASDVVLDLDGLDPAVFGSTVDVEVREATLSGAQGVHGTPRVVSAVDGAALASGSLDLSVPSYDRYAAYQVIITPAQDRTVATTPDWQTSIEAEDTVLSGAQAYTQNPTDGGGWKFLASGGRDVGSFDNASSKADWTVTVPRTGSYRFQVIGSTPGVPGRHALFVDGAKNQLVQYTADLALTNTQKWQYRGSAEVTVELTAGRHTLSLRASENGTTVLPHADITLDKFLLTDVTDGERTVYPASTLRYAGGAQVVYDQGARGFARIADGQRADVYANAWKTGYYDVALDYRTSGASSIDVSVNGREVSTVSAGSAGLWSSTTRLHLVEGINEIELRSATGVLLSTVTTTRAAESDSAAKTIEAESAVKTGAAVNASLAASTGSNVSGGQYVGFIGNGAANTLEIARAAGFDTAGAYDLSVTYSNAELSGRHDYNPQVVDRRIDVTEKGAAGTVGSAYFRYTISWNSFWERTIPLTLASASAPIVLGNATAYAPNIDKVTIAPVSIGTPTTEPIAPALATTATATARCVAGKVVVTVVARNDSAATVELLVSSTTGSRTFAAVPPTKSVSAAFSTRAVRTAAGSVTVVSSATVAGAPARTTTTVGHPALTC